ncbi:hypothetical protein [Algoriella sp.]|uniref:hypothetical protein n=1 Tax=Algoriella sp. TaxID=1872434 RepID=UPI002FC87A94
MTFRELTISTLAKRFLHLFDSIELVNWSIEILKLGYESDDLYILGGLDNEDTIIRENYFFKSLNDLNFIINDKDSILKEYAFYVSKNFINNVLTQDTAINTMYHIYSELDYDLDLEIFYQITIDLEILEDIGYSPFVNITLDNKDEFIFKKFQEYYSKYKPIYDSQ